MRRASSLTSTRHPRVSVSSARSCANNDRATSRRVVDDRRAGTGQKLPARSAAPLRPGGPSRRGGPRTGNSAARFQTQAAQAARRLGAEVERAVARHGATVRRVHRDVVRTGAPHVGDLAVGRRRQERAPASPQHHFPHRGIRVEPQLGAAQEPHAQVEHLERQAVAAGVVVLLDVAAALEDGPQTVHGSVPAGRADGATADRQAARRVTSASQISKALSIEVDVWRLTGLDSSSFHSRNDVPVPPRHCSVRRRSV